MKRLFIYAIGFTAVLVGCGSFNNNFNTYHVLPSGRAVPAVIKLPQDKAESTRGPVAKPIMPSIAPVNAECPIAAFVDLPKPPELPIKQIEQAGRDLEAVEKIERKHISELRQYILIIRKLQIGTKVAFEEKCKAVAKP